MTQQQVQSNRPGQMTAVMRAMPQVTGPKVLRIGLVQGGKVIEERVIKQRTHVTIGPSEKSMFVIPSKSIPPNFRLFELAGGDYLWPSDGRVGDQTPCEGAGEGCGQLNRPARWNQRLAAEESTARDLALANGDFDDLADDLGADADLVLLEVGVVGRDLALQALPVKQPADEQQDRKRNHQCKPAPAPLLRCGRCNLLRFVLRDLKIGFRHLWYLS